MEGDLSGVRWRIVTGKKGPGDLRLDLLAPRWVPVSMALGFLFADFYAQNEETLYPRAAGYSAGDRYMHFVNGAAFLGWEVAHEQLLYERTQRRGGAR